MHNVNYNLHRLSIYEGLGHQEDTKNASGTITDTQWFLKAAMWELKYVYIQLQNIIKNTVGPKCFYYIIYIIHLCREMYVIEIIMLFGNV